ncbi:NUDIX hydrolase [Maribacter stanieri]|jgi:8-oxo-dGTP diphosphatase|uniref:ADP-ribose pyrophosphatase YjhB, NUDIX family n=1 Tax=Maribacter stanieri TaxID=440514 RepID=A0A1I6IHH1_9FLAO|nr:NUDIX domain-containing protein [Maribacter stanieri]SFR66114.1 ADP-ribose pyrophosphatase YjhB, NUDIX family [Maribacter stanieri]|tara:strand:- start:147 stop:878 length:732 start_codon:yes stop_codon:yes gene_type:complete
MKLGTASQNEDANTKLQYYQKEDQVLLSVDCIIFGFDEKELKVLLVKRNFEPEMGKWSLIGGFLKKSENLDEVAIRVLNALTGLKDIYMEQLYSYSRIDRDPGQRTISVAYYALIDLNAKNFDKIKIDSAKWFEINKVPQLIFDHNEMIEKAILRLRRKALVKPIGFELLPEKFTMRELQSLYESILDKKLDKRNFINKVNLLDILDKLDEKDMTSSRKGSFLYRFNEEKYKRKSDEGFDFKI